jgi:protein-disulfide isomerase
VRSDQPVSNQEPVEPTSAPGRARDPATAAASPARSPAAAASPTVSADATGEEHQGEPIEADEPLGGEAWDDELLDDDERAATSARPRRHALASRRSLPSAARSVAVVAVLALVFGSGILVGRVTVPAAESTTTASAAIAAGSAAPSSTTVAPLLDGLPEAGPLLGSATAKVQLTYWADFQCPFCARFAATTLPQLASRIADGTVAVLHRDFVFLGGESLDAAIAVRCAGEQGRYWPMHDAVYAAQAGENQGTFSAATLARLAAGVGVDVAPFTACTQRHDVLVAVLADTAAGVRAAVESTPTIDIPGHTFVGVSDVTTLLQAIDADAAAGTAPTPAPSVQPSGDPWAGTTTSGRTAGAPSAPVTVTLWVDYQATGMPAVASTLEPELRTRIGAGTVRVVLRDLATLGDESTAAASLVRCGAQDNERAVWLAHDALSVSAQGAGAGVFTARSLLWFAAKLGWDVTALDACMSDPATASAIAADTAAGLGMHLSAAPAIVVASGGKETARFSGSSIDMTKVLAAIDAAAK